MDTTPWQFAIDVGGTFTDCLATTPEGTVRRIKLLSSGRLRCGVRMVDGTPRLTFPFDTADHLFDGFQCEGFAADGSLIFQSRILQWEAATGVATVDQEVSWEACRTVELHASLPAPVIAIRVLLGTPLNQPLPRLELRLGTTRGTNALLTGAGARVGLLTNYGFGDSLTIGTQQRPELFARDVVRPETLVWRTAEVKERTDYQGQILESLDLSKLRDQLVQWRADGIESLAISFLHSYQNPESEKLAGDLARDLGFEFVSLSHRVSPLIKFINRTSTTVLDAYLNPVLQSYLQEIGSQLSDDSHVLLMTSRGGLVAPEQFSGKDSILSGPAGGAVGFATAARVAGFSRAIGFDMGGTSTDVSRLDGELNLQNETRKAGVEIQTPMLAIETVAAGGGSICSFSGNRLTVGPRSAGADPGPACYGRGGPLTVTDLNVYLKRVPSDRFPFPLQYAAIEKRLDDLISRVLAESGVSYTRQSLVQALLEIANSHMASAINTVSTRQGVDPRDYVLVGFGGAAGQHLCGVADCLDISRILLHPDAGILSAFGISQASIQKQIQSSLLCALDGLGLKRIRQVVRQSGQQLLRNKSENTSIQWLVRLQLCVKGTQQALSQFLDFSDLDQWTEEEIRDQFWADFEARFGYRQDRPIEIQDVLVEMRTGQDSPSMTMDPIVALDDQLDRDRPECIPRENLQRGVRFDGPVVITESHATTFVAQGWCGELLSDGQLLLTREELPVSAKASVAIDGLPETSEVPCEPHRLELFHHRLTDIATQMGSMLQATCTSVNVKERLDFSCAVFDSDGNLLVNAPHIPVHLGAMGETVRHTIQRNPTVQPGDHFVTNDPFLGGSHLPDVTLITPVFSHETPSLDPGARPRFWVASRAHHAEIGGVTPGSMPPFSTCLQQEGVLLRNVRIPQHVDDPFADVTRLLSSGPFPSRNVNDNVQDLQAQLAANCQGVRLLRELQRDWTLPVVEAYVQHILDTAQQQVVKMVDAMEDREYRFEDQLDCGLTIRLVVRIQGQAMEVDFSGTDPPAGNNFNTNPAIVLSAILYGLRLMLDSRLPLNEGVLRPVRLVLPHSFLNPVSTETDPAKLPAVVGGNVETSQRIVDVFLGALQVAAASQGTMNNFLFGNQSFGFYETIGGGTGATSTACGADAVHSHMTNTRLTDPEILERRYPIRLNQFAIRTGSGGAGKRSGGCGMIRRFEFLAPLTVSLLTNRRGPGPGKVPYGLAGGASGQPGENWLVQVDGRREPLAASCQLEVEPGQQIEIRTPGGGGWGDASSVGD